MDVRLTKKQVVLKKFNFFFLQKIYVYKPVCCANDEYIFLGSHSVHFCQKLVDNSICGTT